MENDIEVKFNGADLKVVYGALMRSQKLALYVDVLEGKKEYELMKGIETAFKQAELNEAADDQSQVQQQEAPQPQPKQRAQPSSIRGDLAVQPTRKAVNQQIKREQAQHDEIEQVPEDEVFE